jgi:hypothetical protein
VDATGPNPVAPPAAIGHSAGVLKSVELSRAFYTEAVRPLLGDLPHAAARVGPGSDVLGFDTSRSTDHDWGPRVEVFLAPADEHRADEVSATLAARLPTRFRGWSTHFARGDNGVRVMAGSDGPVAHFVPITTASAWFDRILGFDPRHPVTRLDWLSTPWQRFAEVTGGAVFHDDLGDLTTARQRLAWYPDDLWRYALAGQWARIGEEEAFVGRAAEAGDDTGSRVLAARLARDVMRLTLLLGRRWPPYPKWLGVAFARAPGTTRIAAALDRALGATDGDTRQDALCDAYELVGALQNSLALAPAVDPIRRRYFDRPYPVIAAGRYAEALGGSGHGTIDQLVDNTDLLTSPRRCRALMLSA